MYFFRIKGPDFAGDRSAIAPTALLFDAEQSHLLANDSHSDGRIIPIAPFLIISLQRHLLHLGLGRLLLILILMRITSARRHLNRLVNRKWHTVPHAWSIESLRHFGTLIHRKLCRCCDSTKQHTTCNHHLSHTLHFLELNIFRVQSYDRIRHYQKLSRHLVRNGGIVVRIVLIICADTVCIISYSFGHLAILRLVIWPKTLIKASQSQNSLFCISHPARWCLVVGAAC